MEIKLMNGDGSGLCVVVLEVELMMMYGGRVEHE